MLSRVADSCYWLSRYIERAETNSRLLHVNMNLMLDLEDADHDSVRAHWQPVLARSRIRSSSTRFTITSMAIP